jgi:NADH-quinone oxidoreductase subunit C
MSEEQKQNGARPEEGEAKAPEQQADGQPQAAEAPQPAADQQQPAEAPRQAEQPQAAAESQQAPPQPAEAPQQPAAPQPGVEPKHAEAQQSAGEAKQSAPQPAAEPSQPAASQPAAAQEKRPLTDEEKEARRQAALAARAAKLAAQGGAAAGASAGAAAGARAAAGGAAAAGGEGAAAEPPKPSPNQPKLDRAVQLLKELVAEDAVEEATLNPFNDDMPTLVIRGEHWLKAAEVLRDHKEFGFRFLRNVAGVDYETHMEVVYHLLNMDSGDTYCVKVRTNRDNPSVPSVTPLWSTANWQEREIYDLLGIAFPGHPDLRRIMLPEDWVGHPLRKDYVPLDPEV